MIAYHRTTREAAASILGGGFRDNKGFILAGTDLELEGVFISDIPLDAGNGGQAGGVLLRVDLAVGESELNDYELVDESGEQPYREWCVPAALINTHAVVTEVDEDES